MIFDKKFFGTVFVVTTAIILAAAALLNGGNKKPVVVSPEILVKNDSHIFGLADAKITLVEFSDFECPACKNVQPVVKEILQKYNGQIRFVYLQYPLPNHQFAQIAAQAAEAAALQNKFWEMHDLLFAKSPDLSREKLFEYAQSLNLDMGKFGKDFDSDVVKQKIAADKSDGDKIPLAATPTFFINGTKLKGILSLDNFRQILEANGKQ